MVNLPPLKREERWARNWLWLVVGLGVGLRMGLGMVQPLSFPDSVDYQTLARAILGHQVYGVPNTLPGQGAGISLASRMPGYPVFMAGMYLISHGSMAAVLWAQAIMGGFSILLTYLIALRVNKTVALIAATLAAFDPLSLGFSAAILSETPFTFFMLLSLWILLLAMERRQAWWRWLLIGEMWGIAVYFRASALWCLVPLVVLAALGSKTTGKQRWMRLAGAGLAVAMMFVILSPWLSRNYRIFHSGPLRLTTLEGISLYEAVYPGADGGPKQDKIVWPEEFLKWNEAQRNDEWGKRAMAEIRADPMRVAGLALTKMGRTWSPWFNGGEFRGRVMQVGMIAWHVPLYIFGLIGLFHRGGDGRWKWMLLIVLFYFTAVHAVYLGSVRYRVPLMPLVCVFAAAGIYETLKWLGWVKPVVAGGV